MAGFDPEKDIRKDGENYWIKVTPGRLDTFLTRYIDGGDMAGKNVGTAERFLALLEYVAERQLTNRKILTTCDVYVFAALGVVKIGIAADVPDRLRRLQTASHDQIQMVKSWRFASRGIAFEVEKAAHKHFAEFWKSGEWFAVAQEDAVALLDREFAKRNDGQL